MFVCPFLLRCVSVAIAKLAHLSVAMGLVAFDTNFKSFRIQVQAMMYRSVAMSALKNISIPCP